MADGDALRTEDATVAPEPAVPTELGGGTVIVISPEHVTMHVDGEPPTKKRRGTWKRATVGRLGQSEVPPVVEDVDSHKSFSLFDGGWILPNGSRRNNRSARPTLSPEQHKKALHPGMWFVSLLARRVAVLRCPVGRSTRVKRVGR